ncbi:MAG: aminoacyl-tRNA hydrolase [Bdellovibrionaceae bacterium]|jgi:ribosome-associated protein|nr:aminoacyl-tRNA hydrolase [Pseudobdellovibrionaceae bacterium]
MGLSEHQIGLIKGECEISFSLSSGPGGQNVNKNSTKATLRWSLLKSKLPEALKNVLYKKLSNKLTVKHELVISNQTSRVQSDNVKSVYEKFIDLIIAALIVPKRRVPTRPSKNSKTRRLDSKTKDALTKKNRKKVDY